MRAFLLASAAAALGLPAAAYAHPSEAPSQALGESAEATAALTEAGVRVTSGALAAPIGSAALAADSTGDVTTAAADSAGGVAAESWEFGTAPLSITDETIIAADPPPNVPREPFAEELDGDTEGEDQ